jgi:hypothetical protein
MSRERNSDWEPLTKDQLNVPSAGPKPALVGSEAAEEPAAADLPSVPAGDAYKPIVAGMPLDALKGKDAPMVTWSLKLSQETYQELSDVAVEYRTDMAKIVRELIERNLPLIPRRGKGSVRRSTVK